MKLKNIFVYKIAVKNATFLGHKSISDDRMNQVQEVSICCGNGQMGKNECILFFLSDSYTKILKTKAKEQKLKTKLTQFKK